MGAIRGGWAFGDAERHRGHRPLGEVLGDSWGHEVTGGCRWYRVGTWVTPEVVEDPGGRGWLQAGGVGGLAQLPSPFTDAPATGDGDEDRDLAHG